MNNLLKKTLSNNGWIQCNKYLAKTIGIYESILISELISKYNYLEENNKINNEWFFYLKKDIEDNTGLSNHKAWKTMSHLQEIKFIDIKRKGIPSKHFFKILDDNIIKFIENPLQYIEKYIDPSDLKIKWLSDLKIKSLAILKLNVYSTNNKNINKKNKKEDKCFPIENTKTSIKKLNSSIEKIIKEILPIGNFTNKIYKKDKSIHKTIFSIEKFILSMKEGRLSQHYKFDPNWIDKYNIIIPNGKFDNNEIILKNFKKAIKRYNKMKIEGYWPPDKSGLTTNFMNFLYNPRSHKSRFLYCLSNRPIKIREAEVDKLVDKLDPNIRQIAIKYKQKDWDEVIYWEKIYKLYKWYDESEDGLSELNMPRWEGVCGSFSMFLEKIKEFSETWSNWNIGNFGYNNSTWKIFARWLKEKYEININFSKKAIKKAIENYNNNIGIG